MADNTTLNQGVGGDVIATDDIGGVKYQRVKVNYGGDGSSTDVDANNPLPVTDATSSASANKISTLNSRAASSVASSTFNASILWKELF